MLTASPTAGGRPVWEDPRRHAGPALARPCPAWCLNHAETEGPPKLCPQRPISPQVEARPPGSLPLRAGL